MHIQPMLISQVIKKKLKRNDWSNADLSIHRDRNMSDTTNVYTKIQNIPTKWHLHANKAAGQPQLLDQCGTLMQVISEHGRLQLSHHFQGLLLEVSQ